MNILSFRVSWLAVSRLSTWGFIFSFRLGIQSNFGLRSLNIIFCIETFSPFSLFAFSPRFNPATSVLSPIFDDKPAP
jgi:hypothetical protein